MKNKSNLEDVFDNGGYDHFTHFDYLKQLIENGQLGAFKDHLKEMSNEALVSLANNVEGYSYQNNVKVELLNRMEK
jgi:hypothetical protein